MQFFAHSIHIHMGKQGSFGDSGSTFGKLEKPTHGEPAHSPLHVARPEVRMISQDTSYITL